MDNNIIYIFDGRGVLHAPLDWYNNLKPETITNRYDELANGKYMPLTEEQIAFHLFHPHYDLYHSFYMLPIPIEEQNNEIRKRRENLYLHQSDPLYMSYVKYKEFGDNAKAEAAYKTWQDKVEEIELKNPYLSEDNV